MRRILAILISSAALLAAQTAYAPDHSMFEHARVDLDRASNYPYASPADRRRFDDARTRLFDFESRFDRGRYDRHRLDDAIDRIKNVVSHNSLDPRDRGALDDDLRRMRDYREFRNHPY